MIGKTKLPPGMWRVQARSRWHDQRSGFKAMKCNRSLSPSAMALVVLTAGALPLAQAQSYFGSPVEGSLCHTGETVLFACPSGQKRIAVCAAPAGGSPFGVLRYRFGSSSHTELEFPIRPKPAREYASGNSLGDDGRGTLVYLRLNNGDTSYTVYAEAVSPTYQRTDASDRSGVVVERHGKLLATFKCDAGARTYSGMLLEPKFLGDAVPLDPRVPPGFPTYLKRSN